MQSLSVCLKKVASKIGYNYYKTGDNYNLAAESEARRERSRVTLRESLATRLCRMPRSQLDVAEQFFLLVTKRF
jgi:hypothetical protein